VKTEAGRSPEGRSNFQLAIATGSVLAGTFPIRKRPFNTLNWNKTQLSQILRQPLFICTFAHLQIYTSSPSSPTYSDVHVLYLAHKSVKSTGQCQIPVKKVNRPWAFNIFLFMFTGAN